MAGGRPVFLFPVSKLKLGILCWRSLPRRDCSLCVRAPIVVGLHRALELPLLSLYLGQVGILGSPRC